MRAIRWNDWAWNLKAAAKLAGRVIKLVTGKAVR
jgi:hypothetical protein